MEEWTLSKVEVLVSSHIYSWEGRGGEFVHFDDPLTDGQRKRNTLVDLRSTLTYQRAKKIRALDPVKKKGPIWNGKVIFLTMPGMPPSATQAGTDADRPCPRMLERRDAVLA